MVDGLVTICQLFLSVQLITFCQYRRAGPCRSTAVIASVPTNSSLTCSATSRGMPKNTQEGTVHTLLFKLKPASQRTLKSLAVGEPDTKTCRSKVQS